jgi:hypothetical protein
MKIPAAAGPAVATIRPTVTPAVTASRPIRVVTVGYMSLLPASRGTSGGAADS